jgi:hypothetical protein
MDAMHPTQATKVSCGWIKKGQDKTIEITGSRTRLNIIGAVSLNKIADEKVKRYDKVNSETTQQFFSELLRQHDNSGKLIHLILDGAVYHRANTVKDKAKELNIELHYLLTTLQSKFKSDRAALESNE